jgi:hypothetical protein
MTTLNITSSSMKQAQRGVAVVEFAIVIIPLLLIVAGIIEFGRTFWYYDALAKSTRDAARYISNARFSSTLAVDEDIKVRAENMVYDAVNAAGVPDFLPKYQYVDITCDPNCTEPDYVKVSIVAYPVVIGGWIPIIAPNGVSTWDVKVSPATTMPYMR